MGRKEIDKLKEAEKAHLREMQQLKRRLREVERMRSIGKALQDVESAGSSDEFDEALSRVQLEALEGEAKLDMMLDSQGSASSTEEPDPIEAGEELSKARAAEMVRHMKISMGLSDGAPEAEEMPTRPDGPESVAQPGPDMTKTIGRMKPTDD